MYVETFYGDNLDETLNAVKKKLGPDAIILKTVTNKGLKGAFRKNRVEVTAAISEKSYIKKSKVDQVLDDNQKETFYRNRASDIASSIDQYGGAATAGSGNDYGQLGLNRVVNKIGDSTKDATQRIRSGLDDFLSGDLEQDNGVSNNDALDDFVQNYKPQTQQTSARPQEQVNEKPVHRQPNMQQQAPVERDSKVDELLHAYKVKIELLEDKLFQVTQQLEKLQNVAQVQKSSLPGSVEELQFTLKSLGICDAFIQQLLRKANYELSEQEVNNPDILFEFGLKEIASSLNTKRPLFSAVEGDTPVITVLLSETSSGQSSMAVKLAALKEKSVIISHNSGELDAKHRMAKNIFNLEVAKVETTAEIYAECRKAMEQGKSVFIDFNHNQVKADETKLLVEGLKRSFADVEILLSLSAIAAETYNRKIISKYQDLADGTIISHVDLCLNYGSLLNIHLASDKLPMVFFGTGSIIPDDIEAATPERIIAGMFKF